jgi:hypothetical protein
VMIKDSRLEQSSAKHSLREIQNIRAHMVSTDSRRLVAKTLPQAIDRLQALMHDIVRTWAVAKGIKQALDRRDNDQKWYPGAANYASSMVDCWSSSTNAS